MLVKYIYLLSSLHGLASKKRERLTCTMAAHFLIRDKRLNKLIPTKRNEYPY